MENKLEQLLNSLIEKGWFPRWEREPIYMLSSKKLYIPDTMEVNRSLRDLVSKESWLWQFVCENGMVEEWWYVNGWCYHNDYDEYDEWDWETYDKELRRFYDKNYEYRLIESALCDEDKLEDFILGNIKVEW